jgi:ligand-binding sensor domain-containing protein
MVLDGDDVLWALTADGLGWFSDGSWHFPDESPYRGSVIRCIGVDAGGSLLIADEEAVRRKSGDGWKIVVAREDLPGRDVLDVTEGAGGRLWVVTDRAIAIAPAGDG